MTTGRINQVAIFQRWRSEPKVVTSRSVCPSLPPHTTVTMAFSPTRGQLTIASRVEFHNEPALNSPTLSRQASTGDKWSFPKLASNILSVPDHAGGPRTDSAYRGVPPQLPTPFCTVNSPTEPRQHPQPHCSQRVLPGLVAPHSPHQSIRQYCCA